MQILFYIYLIFLCGVLPLYMKTGYYELGEAKAVCYLVGSAIPAVIALVRALLNFWKKRAEVISAAEFCLFGSIFSVVFSFAFSIDKKTAFWGYEGWRNGLLVTLVAMFIGLFASKRAVIKKNVLVVLMVVPFIQFVLTIINRLGLYPFDIIGANASFLATLGNINWASGFFSIWVPLGMGLLYLQEKLSWTYIFNSIYVIVGFMALCMQGSEGAGLIFVGSFCLLLWCALSDRSSFRRFLNVAGELGIAMFLVDVICLISPDAYNYSPNLLMEICKAHVGIVILAAVFFLYRVSRLFEVISISFRTKIYRTLLVVGVWAAVLLAAFVLYYTFDDGFGNGRGIIWKMCFELYSGLAPWQKVVGIGQDCLYPYAMADAVWSSSFTNVFGNAALTNAHCELLTTLIERGMLGAAFYLGLFVSVIYELVKIYKKEPTAIVCALPIISCFLYNQVSFSQVLSFPYLYILLGIAIGLFNSRNRD